MCFNWFEYLQKKISNKSIPVESDWRMLLEHLLLILFVHIGMVCASNVRFVLGNTHDTLTCVFMSVCLSVCVVRFTVYSVHTAIQTIFDRSLSHIAYTRSCMCVHSLLCYHSIHYARGTLVWMTERKRVRLRSRWSLCISARKWSSAFVLFTKITQKCAAHFHCAHRIKYICTAIHMRTHTPHILQQHIAITLVADDLFLLHTFLYGVRCVRVVGVFN